MPVADPISGRLFIWFVSCVLFISIAAGGSCLLMYTILPQDPSRAWLPVAGVTLVCLPWAFWLFTCIYRVVSRTCGFRFVLGFGISGGGGGGGGGGGSGGGGASDDDPGNPESALESAGEDGKHVHFGGAVMMGGQDNDDEGSRRSTVNKRSLTASHSSNDMSVTSHESEMPLTSAMAS